MALTKKIDFNKTDYDLVHEYLRHGISKNTAAKLLGNETSLSKNKAFEELKNINQNSSVEEKIENKIKEKYNKECFVKIDNDQIRIVIGSNDHSTELANEIMRLVQEEFDKKMYISVQFQN